jgi:hypothetical protein
MRNYALRSLRLSIAKPIKPEPNKELLTGSGTCDLDAGDCVDDQVVEIVPPPAIKSFLVIKLKSLTRTYSDQT